MIVKWRFKVWLEVILKFGSLGKIMLRRESNLGLSFWGGSYGKGIIVVNGELGVFMIKLEELGGMMFCRVLKVVVGGLDFFYNGNILLFLENIESL